MTERKDYPNKPEGSSASVASDLYKKYRDRIELLTRQMKPIKYDY